MSTVLFDQLQTKLRSEGPSASIEYLCQHLRDSGEYNSLFYALLMKKRLELGAVPIPTGPASDLPAAVHAEYEDAIRSSAREVGGLYLQAGKLSQAWAFFAHDRRTPADPRRPGELPAWPRRGYSAACPHRLLRRRSPHPRLRLDHRALRHLQRHHQRRRRRGAALRRGETVLHPRPRAGAATASCAPGSPGRSRHASAFLPPALTPRRTRPASSASSSPTGIGCSRRRRTTSTRHISPA